MILHPSLSNSLKCLPVFLKPRVFTLSPRQLAPFLLFLCFTVTQSVTLIINPHWWISHLQLFLSPHRNSKSCFQSDVRTFLYMTCELFYIFRRGVRFLWCILMLGLWLLLLPQMNEIPPPRFSASDQNISAVRFAAVILHFILLHSNTLMLHDSFLLIYIIHISKCWLIISQTHFHLILLWLCTLTPIHAPPSCSSYRAAACLPFSIMYTSC